MDKHFKKRLNFNTGPTAQHCTNVLMTEFDCQQVRDQIQQMKEDSRINRGLIMGIFIT